MAIVPAILAGERDPINRPSPRGKRFRKNTRAVHALSEGKLARGASVQFGLTLELYDAF